MLAAVHELRERLAGAGRRPDSVTVTVHGAAPDRANVDAVEAGGIDRVLFTVPSANQDVGEPYLDRLAKLIR